MATADRRPRRTRVWWVIPEFAYVTSREESAREICEHRQRAMGRTAELVRVIESPGGRGKRGRKKP